MKSIGKYEVLDEIASGVTGTTYRVRESFQKRELILKLLCALPTLDEASHDAFCREMLLYSELTHRHLVKILDLGEVDGRIYIVTRLLSGAGLLTYANENRELPIAAKLGILAQAAEGLAFVHSRDIRHGAIKPGNIFVDASGDVTLLDLGIAKWESLILAAGARPEGLQPNYFAPEQILGQPCDSKSDLFSLALVSYEFLTGRYPFQVPASLIPREIVHSEPEPLRAVSPEMPEELEQLLIRGLKKKPEERLETAEEFAATLYVIAQHVRRPQATAVPEILPSTAVPAVSNPPVSEPPAPAPQAEQSAKTPKREDVQAAKPEAQPWTTRSYASNGGSVGDSRPPVQTGGPAPVATPPVAATKAGSSNSAEIPGISAQTPAPLSDAPAAPAPTPPLPIASAPVAPPPARLKAPPPSPTRVVARRAPAPMPLKKRIIAIAAGAILAIYLMLSFISHQGLHASQTVSSKPAAPNGPASSPLKPDADHVAAPEQTPPVLPDVHPEPIASPSEIAKSGPPPEQILRKQVKPLWEAGKYADAMALVDDLLVKNPASAEARAWKKRIRAAQQAEAAIK